MVVLLISHKSIKVGRQKLCVVLEPVKWAFLRWYTKLTFFFQFLSGDQANLEMTKRLNNTHHARWMGSCLYILKMLICGDEIVLGAQQKADIRVMSFYIVYVHFYFWFSCPRMADAPFLTLALHADLSEWASRDPAGARAGQRKVDLHTEYLTGRSVVLALASEKVGDTTKKAMVAALLTFDSNTRVELGRPPMPRVYDDSKLEDFISEESWLFFQLCGFEPSFLSSPVENWHTNGNYHSFCALVNGFSPLNDAGERAVKFASDFNGAITRDNEQHQAMLQGIEAHRRAHPKPTKF